MQKLNITITDFPNLEKAQLVRFEGDFDGVAKENLADIEVAVENCPEDCLMIFDFSQLDYLNSFALGQLVTWHNIIEAKKGKVVIVGTNDHVKDIFTVLGVDNIFKTYSTLEEANMDLHQHV